MSEDTDAPFSRRLGYRSAEPKITIREDAPDWLRLALVEIAGELGLSAALMRKIACRTLFVAPNPDNWSEGNVWGEVIELLSGCEWYSVYDIAEALYTELEGRGGPPPWQKRTGGDGDAAAQYQHRLNQAFRDGGIGWQMQNGKIMFRGSEPFEAVTQQASDTLEEHGRSTAAREIHEALGDLSRRPKPDVSGAIQHAMAALECVARCSRRHRSHAGRGGEQARRGDWHRPALGPSPGQALGVRVRAGPAPARGARPWCRGSRTRGQRRSRRQRVPIEEGRPTIARSVGRVSKPGQFPPLGATGRDRAVAVARALAGMVPIAGSLLAELIAEVVPEQRQERIEDWLRQLAERLASVEETSLRERLRARENVALFEEGIVQASRAMSEERRSQIAELVAGGIADDRRDYIESHRVLRLLGELDDAEVIILAGYLQRNREGDYWARHANVLRDLAAHLGSSRDETDADTVRQAGRQHLVQLGLLDQGAIGGAASIQLSRLGRLLLRRIGLAGNDDW